MLPRVCEFMLVQSAFPPRRFLYGDQSRFCFDSMGHGSSFPIVGGCRVPGTCATSLDGIGRCQDINLWWTPQASLESKFLSLKNVLAAKATPTLAAP